MILGPASTDAQSFGALISPHRPFCQSSVMTLGILLLLQQVGHSQTPSQPAEGLILGKVIDGVTGQPVRGALVTVGAGGVGGSGTFRRTLTDTDGRFVAFRLPPGDYRILAHMDGYGIASSGGRGPGRRLLPELPRMERSAWQRLTLRAGERRGDLVITMWKYGAIAGRVTDQTGQPIAGLHVQAWPRVEKNGGPGWGSLVPLVAWTDDRGEYRIVHAVAGEYVVVVPAVSLTAPVGLLSTQGATGWNLPMLGVFRLHEPGREYGELVPQAGREHTVSAGAWLESLTGRRSLGADAASGFATTFAPGASDPGAAMPVTVAAGVDSPPVDIRLVPQALHSVSGVLIGPDGPISHQMVTLTRSIGASPWQVAIGVSDKNGAFRLNAVPAGAYVLEVHVWPGRGLAWIRPGHAPEAAGIFQFAADPFSEKPTLWARHEVVVGDADLENVRLTLRTGARLSGHVEFRGTATAPAGQDLGKVALDLDRPDGWDLAAQAQTELDVADDGAFTSIGLPAGQYLIRAPEPPAGWTLLAVTHGGRDISVDPLDLGSTSIDDITVIFTDDPSRVSGSVSGTTTVPASAATVVAFPREERSWRPLGTYPRRMQATRVDTEGRFALVGLPPGDYIVAAIDEAEMVDWPSRELLSVLARVGRHARLEATTKMDLTLRMVPVR